jgi:hypothetical protein
LPEQLISKGFADLLEHEPFWNWSESTKSNCKFTSLGHELASASCSNE